MLEVWNLAYFLVRALLKSFISPPSPEGAGGWRYFFLARAVYTGNLGKMMSVCPSVCLYVTRPKTPPTVLIVESWQGCQNDRSTIHDVVIYFWFYVSGRFWPKMAVFWPLFGRFWHFFDVFDRNFWTGCRIGMLFRCADSPWNSAKNEYLVDSVTSYSGELLAKKRPENGHFDTLGPFSINVLM